VIVALWIAVLVLASLTILLALVVSGLVQAMNELRMVDAALRSLGPKGLPAGAMAPSISGTLPDGKAFDPSLLAGRTHLVAFVSPDCAPCEPLLRDLADPSQMDGLPLAVVVSRSGSADGTAMAGLLDRTGLVVLADPEDAMADRFQTHTTPHVFVVDAAGTIRAQGVANDLRAVRELMDGWVRVP
jgi:redoxin